MSKRYRYTQILRLLATGALAGVCSPVGASGFQIMEQNVTNLGTAYAGTASLAMDASTGFYNAAGLTRICKEQIAFSLVGIRPNSKLDVTSAKDRRGANVAGVPGTARVRGDALVPGVHYAYRYSDNWAFGFNVTSPFGLKTNYDSDSVVRYMSIRSDLRTYDVAPSLAYSFGNGLSVGFGPDFVHANFQLDSISDISPGGQEILSETRLSRWGVGGHAGVLYEFSDCTRLGLNYRSQLRIKGKGQIHLYQGGGLALQGSANTTAKLPDTAVVSFFHQLDDCWAVMADAQWTHWSIVKDLTINGNINGVTGSSGTKFDFKDSYRLALGTSYQWDDCWLFRFGVAYDRSPVRNDNTRTTQIPDSHRTWVAVGGRYHFTKSLALDVGYAHLFLKKAGINQSGLLVQGVPQNNPSINGTYKQRRADMLGVQLTWDLA